MATDPRMMGAMKRNPAATAAMARRPAMPPQAGGAARPPMPAAAGAGADAAAAGMARRPAMPEQAPAMKKGGSVKKMAFGGLPTQANSNAAAGMARRPAMPAASGMKSGGSVSKRADGVATKGKTKGTMVKMAKGGMAKKKGC